MDQLIAARGSLSTAGDRARSPLLFVQNNGQFDPQARFQLHGAATTLWMTDKELWLTVLKHDERRRTADGRRRGYRHSSSAPSASSGQALRPSPSVGVHLRLTFPGMNPGARLVASDPQPAKMNYFLDSDASHWRSNVATVGGVRWEAVYPGVNIVIRDSSLTVEASPDADLSMLRLRVEGADAIRVDADDRLVADTAAGPVRLPPLLTGEGRLLRPVVAEDSITFTPRPFNPLPESPALVSGQAADGFPDNDPGDLLYSTFLGGSGIEDGEAIALGADGSAYVAGYTESTDFPTTPGAFDPTLSGVQNVFVTKLNPSGSGLVYSTFLGGHGIYGDEGLGIAVGSDGSAYITGDTTSNDFPTTPGAFDTTYNGGPGGTDAFITKLSVDGSTLTYSTFLGGSSEDRGLGIAVGPDGSAYVTGSTASPNFPTTPGAFDTTYNGQPFGDDAFITKLSADGSALTYSTFLGGGDYDDGYGIALGADSSAYVAGYTFSSDFPTTPGAFDTTENGLDDVFVTKLNAGGSALVYSTFLGGSGYDQGTGIALDISGSVYVTGQAQSVDFPTTPGAFDTTCHLSSGRCADAFATELNASGNDLVYSTFLGGTGDDSADSITVASDGTVYVTGDTECSDFPTTSGAFDTSYNGNGDAFITKLNAGGSAVVYSTFLGGSGTYGDSGSGIAVASDGSAYVIGRTTSSDFPITPGAFDTTFAGNDAFVARVSPDLSLMHVASINPQYRPSGVRFRVRTTVTIQDANRSAVSDAAVTLDVTLPNGNQTTVTRTTNSSGVATDSFLTSQTGTYTFTVTNVSKLGYNYDPLHNVETSDSVTIP